MAPKNKQKCKEKVTVVHDEDLIPFKTLNKKIDTKTFKILKESRKWNEVLIDTKVLAGIIGLTDSMIHQISEAVDKIIVNPLKAEFEFEKTLFDKVISTQ